VLFRLLNGSATEIRSLALPGHSFTVVAMDGNPIPKPVTVPGLWLGTAERVSAIVEMSHPGVSIMGDTADDDRQHGMGIVVEYAGAKGKPQWVAEPDQVFEMAIVKQNAAEGGFNRWTINGIAFSEDQMRPMFRVTQGKRYRLRMRNASDDIHPVHLHRHSFELTRVAGLATLSWWAATRRWRSISSRIILGWRCFIVIRSYIWLWVYGSSQAMGPRHLVSYYWK